MTTRTAVLTAIIGLVIVASCAIPLYYIGNQDPANDNAVMGIILLGLIGILGLTILVVRLIIATVTVMQSKHQQPH